VGGGGGGGETIIIIIIIIIINATSLVPPVLCKQKIFCGTYPQIGKIYITDCCY
jgi:hypothetical protein